MNSWGRIAVIVTLLLPPSLLLAQELSPTPNPPSYSDSVYINEFLPDPSSAQGPDSDAEFIELYNDSDEEADISSWIIDTGSSNAPSIPSGTTIPAHGFLVFFSGDEDPDLSIALTNAGDTIKLFQPDDTVQDEVTYASSQAGYSYNRIEAGTYQQSPINTPGEANLFPSPTPTITPAPSASASPSPTISPTTTPSLVPTSTPTPTPNIYSSAIYLNEFLPNPIGDDKTLEFIELFNSSDDNIDISGWFLEDSSGDIFEIPDGTIISGSGYLALYTGPNITLNNAGDHVRLLDPEESVHEDAAYSGSKEGYSYNRMDDGSYRESSTSTPGAKNNITIKEDPSPTPISTAKTQVKDDEEDEQIIAYHFSSKIIINEFLPNPVGSDTDQEFIEIKNLDAKAINLLGWKLDDGEKGSSPYKFTADDAIGPGEVAVFFRSETNIALNNDTDIARLIDPSGKVIHEVAYRSPVPEGQSYARDGQGSFFWSGELTPDEENIIIVQVGKNAKALSSKAKTAPKAASRSGSVLSASDQRLSSPPSTLAWPEVNEGVVSRTVIGTQRQPHSGKQTFFVILGSIAACAQFLNGAVSKEKIWQKR